MPHATYFYGWNVVAATFVVAMFSFGLGFYGIAAYVGAFQSLHGWSASAVSAPVTVYYLAGALLTAWAATAYGRFGPRRVVALASLAMAIGVSALGAVTAPWHLYAAFLVMAIGWGAMSGAGLNIIVAPWFERRRGLAISLAFNGAPLGGVLVAPALILLIREIGFARAVPAAAIAMLVVLVPVAAVVMRAGPSELGLGPDGDAPGPAGPARARIERSRRDAVRTWRFWSVSVPFAMALAAQVGILTHLVALITPALGLAGAARAMSLTMAAGIAGRLATGVIVDRVNPRTAASATIIVQAIGVALLAVTSDGHAILPAGPYLACALFGLGVGNLTTLPGIILASEWPTDRFPALVGLAVAINQCTFAFGPTLVGIVRDLSGGFAAPLALCMGLEALAAVAIIRKTSSKER
jgi:MFS family permease